MNYNNPDLRILNIHHSDMDGISSAIVLKNFYRNVITVPINYQSEERVVKTALEKYTNQFDAIIVTDFYPQLTINQLKAIAPVLVLDHHESAEKYNDNNMIVINTSMCGAKLTYRFISKFTDISYLNEFIEIINDWDMFILNDIRSKYFNTIYWEMGNSWFIRRFIKGNVKLYPEEKQYLIDAQQEFHTMYEKLEISELSNKGVFFETSIFMSECIEALKKEGYEWFVIKNKNNLSVRTDSIDLMKVFDIFNTNGYSAGGHLHAGGIPLNYKSDIGKVLNDLQLAYDAVYSND